MATQEAIDKVFDSGYWASNHWSSNYWRGASQESLAGYSPYDHTVEDEEIIIFAQIITKIIEGDL